MSWAAIRNSRFCTVFAAYLLVLGAISPAQERLESVPNVPVHLQVATGTPLRLYITNRVRYRLNEPVNAKVMEPVWSFDRIVIPVGATVQGRIVKLDAVPKSIRARAILNGDFTPLKRAQVSFTSMTLPDGHTLTLHTGNSLGLPTIYVPPRPEKQHKKHRTKAHKSNYWTQLAQQQAQNQINAKTRGLYDFVRGPNKKEWLENFLLSKLPYHHQWYRAGTRFDAGLSEGLDFGSVSVPSKELAGIGAPPPPDSIAQMRILSTISSANAHVGDGMEGMLSQPLFSADHTLILPQGTLMKGKITLVRSARLLHRGGKLRFALDDIEVPSDAVTVGLEAAALNQIRRPTQAQLAAVEADPNALKVDSEGTAKATESKTRLLRPAIAALIAAKSMDNDTGKQTASGGGDANTGGRLLGGFSGFGLLGMAASYGPHQVASLLGFYGLGWSVYTNVVARGNEVTFKKNTAMAIRFGAPPRRP